MRRLPVARPCVVAAIVIFGTFGPSYAEQQTGPADEEQATAAPRPWRLDVTAGIGYDSNLPFAPLMESAVSGRLRMGLTRRFKSSRTNVDLVATGDGSIQRPLRQYDRVNYAGDLAADYLLSPRTTLRLADSLSQTYTSDSRALVEAGLLLPRSVVRSNDASIEVTHAISPRWTWAVSTRHRIVHFESGLLINESSLGGRGDLSWQATPDSRIGLVYELSDVARELRPGSDFHSLVFYGQRRFGEKASIRLDGGVSQVLPRHGETNRVVPVAIAQFEIRSPKQTLSVTATRSVSQTPGLGRLQLRLACSLRITRTFARLFSAGVDGTLSRSEDPGSSPSSANKTISGGADLGFHLRRDVELSLSVGYRGRDSGLQTVHSTFAALALRVGQNW
jgi:hypothetical protein